MKYLRHRKLYRLVLKIEDHMERHNIIKRLSPEFREFCDKISDRKWEKLSRRLDTYHDLFKVA
jgi:hypothetical protein